MPDRMEGFHGEYLWELDIARSQLLALAAAAPDEIYACSPDAGTRTFCAVLVHIASVNLGLLRLAQEPIGNDMVRIAAMVRANMDMERTVTAKARVIDLLTQSFDSVAHAFAACAPDQLESPGEFFGEPTTLRRLYLRMLAHSHEHMGQAIAYARTFGIEMPWPDPLREFEGDRGRAAGQTES